MDFSIRRVKALVTKEFRDFCKNPNILFMLLLPVGITILYKKFIGGNGKMESFLVTTCISMNIATVGCMVMAMLIAEEKEKNTLRTLMLTPLNMAEFIIGKFIITGILTMIVNIFIFFMFNVYIIHLPIFITVTLLATISVLFCGALVGIFSKDQMQTGIVGMPFYMILFMVPMFSQFNNTVRNIANALPTYNCAEAVNKLISGQSIWAIKFNVLALVLWIVGTAVVFNIIYKRNRTME